MKKLYITVGILLIAFFAVVEQHRQVEAARGEWKTEWLLSEGQTNAKYPENCIYCDYIKPLIGKHHGQEK